jgi:hypothetical protein
VRYGGYDFAGRLEKSQKYCGIPIVNYGNPIK